MMTDKSASAGALTLRAILNQMRSDYATPRWKGALAYADQLEAALSTPAPVGEPQDDVVVGLRAYQEIHRLWVDHLEHCAGCADCAVEVVSQVGTPEKHRRDVAFYELVITEIERLRAALSTPAPSETAEALARRLAAEGVEILKGDDNRPVENVIYKAVLKALSTPAVPQTLTLREREQVVRWLQAAQNYLAEPDEVGDIVKLIAALTAPTPAGEPQGDCKEPQR